MKAALMNQNTLPIIGSGPLASAPVASADNVGMLYLETGDPLWPNGRAWNYRRGFKNAGTDAIVIRDSPLIRNKIRPKIDAFTVEFVFTIEVLGVYQQLISIRNFNSINTSTEQIVILSTNTNKLLAVVGSIASSESANSFIKNKFYRLVFSCNVSGNYSVFINGVSWLTGNSGAFASSVDPLVLSAQIGTSAGSLEGVFCNFKLYTGYSATGDTSGLSLFSSFALDEIAGSTTVSDSLTGVLGDITDGSPTGAIGTPMLVPTQW